MDRPQRPRETLIVGSRPSRKQPGLGRVAPLRPARHAPGDPRSAPRFHQPGRTGRQPGRTRRPPGRRAAPTCAPGRRRRRDLRILTRIALPRAGAGSFGDLRPDRPSDRPLGASDGRLGLPMAAGGVRRAPSLIAKLPEQAGSAKRLLPRAAKPDSVRQRLVDANAAAISPVGTATIPSPTTATHAVNTRPIGVMGATSP